MNQKDDDVKRYVKERYGQAATAPKSSCTCCGGPDPMEQAKAMGYSEAEIGTLPEDALMGLGCGNPMAPAGRDRWSSNRGQFRRFLISDLIAEGKLPEDIRKSFASWPECIAGAMEKQAYLKIIANAGFRDATITAERTYEESRMDDRLAGKITNTQVRAFK